MENASKALIMASSVLLGVMILSIIAYLFYIYGEYSSSTYQKIDAAQIDQFNQQFLRYYGNTSRVETKIINGKEKDTIIIEPIYATIHDVVSLASLARQNNIDYEINDKEVWNEGNYYIRIDIGTHKNTINLEQKDDSQLLNLIKEYESEVKYDTNGQRYIEEKRFVCEVCDVSTMTKRVYHMKFREEKIQNYGN